MKILHLSWGLGETNGAANIARLVMDEQRAAGHEVALASRPSWKQLRAADQVWCHCGWYWIFWLVALFKRFFRARSAGFLHWMPEACYDPVRLAYHGWKKRLAGPFERSALRQADVLVATCPAEAEWIRAYLAPAASPRIEISDIRRFFRIPDSGAVAKSRRILYLGRRHPLKGVEYLERAVADLNRDSSTSASSGDFSLRVVSDHSGAELERDWAWCDTLCLPTLSDNFGLVVAEALSRGKRVVTTDGAPAWDPAVTGTDYGGRLVYLRGYRDGSPARRVDLLRAALT